MANTPVDHALLQKPPRTRALKSRASRDYSCGPRTLSLMSAFVSEHFYRLTKAMAWFVTLVLLWIFGMDHLRAVWRGALVLGAIPPIILMVARLFMEEPEAYKKNAMKRVKIPYWLIIKRYWVKLLAVSFCWFCYDFITYPFGMYAGDITDLATGKNPSLYQTLGWGCLINAFYLPGSFVGAWMSDWFGPKRCMIGGLIIQAVFGFALSGAYNYFSQRIVGFAIMYGICELPCGYADQSFLWVRLALATTSRSLPPKQWDRQPPVRSYTPSPLLAERLERLSEREYVSASLTLGTYFLSSSTSSPTAVLCRKLASSTSVQVSLCYRQ